LANSTNIDKYLIAQIFAREFIALSQYKEWLHLILFYPFTSGYRLKKIELKIQPNNKINSKYINIYLKLIYSISYFIKIMWTLKKLFIKQLDGNYQ
jgi:hypothetical protein